MKSIQFKDAIYTIRNRFVSWLSIVAIMMLGTTGILGILYAGSALRDDAVDYLEKQNYRDFDLVSSTGVSFDDLELICTVEGVNDAEGIIYLDGSLSFEGHSQNLKLLSPTERINIPEIVSGRPPYFKNECLICRELAEQLYIMEGDKVRIKTLIYDQKDILVTEEYTVTGFVASPEYVTKDLDYYALLPHHSFDRKVLGNAFTDALVDAGVSSEVDQLSDSYYSMVEPVEERLVKLCPDLVEAEDDRIRLLREELSPEDRQEFDESVPKPHWEVMGRSVSASFLGLSSSYQVLSSISFWFTPLFALIALMVCFSTITVIVEEQRVQIGTLKALGMNDGQVRAKYLVFGISATVVGELLGIVGAIGMEVVITGSLRGKFLFGEMPVCVDPLFTLGMLLATTLVSSFAVYHSCNHMIRCSAVELMNGSDTRKKAKKRRKNASMTREKSAVGQGQTGRSPGKYRPNRSGIYLNLILRNIGDDLLRVLVSIIIVLESVMMIGTGITMRQGLSKALDSQLHEIWQYDLLVHADAGEDTNDQIEKKLSELNTPFVSVHEENCIASKENPFYETGVRLYATDPEDDLSASSSAGGFSSFFSLKDKDGNPLPVPESGVLITEEMREKDGFTPGGDITILNSALKKEQLRVTGVFMNHIGKDVFISASEYEKAFGEKAGKNCFLVQLSGADEERVCEELMLLPGVRSIDPASEEIDSYEMVLLMFNLVVAIIIFMVIILAFMVQLNLSNIQVSRRMNDILVMRVNGFSMPQVLSYLILETVITTGAGIILGVALGVPFARFMVVKVEVQQIMFVRTPFEYAWEVAAGLCALFSLMINSIAFRKIGKVSLTSIEKG